MNTTSADVRALMCVNRKWKALPANEKMLLSQVCFVHPTAHLIKELKFERDPRPEYENRLIHVTSFAYEEWWLNQDGNHDVFDVPDAIPHFIQYLACWEYVLSLQPLDIPDHSPDNTFNGRYNNDCYFLDRCGFDLGRAISLRSDEDSEDSEDNEHRWIIVGEEDGILSHEY